MSESSSTAILAILALPLSDAEKATAIQAVLNPSAPAKVVTAPAVPAKKDGRNKAARKHNYEARIARRNTTVLGGLTAKERSALYVANPQIHSLPADERAAAWTAIVIAHKG